MQDQDTDVSFDAVNKLAASVCNGLGVVAVLNFEYDLGAGRRITKVTASGIQPPTISEDHLSRRITDALAAAGLTVPPVN